MATFFAASGVMWDRSVNKTVAPAFARAMPTTPANSRIYNRHTLAASTFLKSSCITDNLLHQAIRTFAQAKINLLEKVIIEGQWGEVSENDALRKRRVNLCLCRDPQLSLHPIAWKADAVWGSQPKEIHSARQPTGKATLKSVVSELPPFSFQLAALYDVITTETIIGITT